MAATVLVGLLLLISSHYRPVEGYRTFKDRTLRTSSTGGLIHQVGQRRLLQGGGGTCGSFPDSDPFDGVRDGQTPNAHESCYTASGSVMFCCPGGSTLCSCPPTPPPDSGPFTCYNYVNSNDLNYNTNEPCGAFVPGGASRAADLTPSPTTSSPTESPTPSPTDSLTPSPTPTGSDTPSPTEGTPLPTGSDTPSPTYGTPLPTGSDTPSPTPTALTASPTERPTPFPTGPTSGPQPGSYPRGAVPPVQPGPSNGWCGYDGNGQALNLCTSSLQVQFCCPSGYVCPTADPVIAADPLFSQVVYCQQNNQIPGAYY